MKYDKTCRNCEHAFLKTCKGCSTFGNNPYENFKLRSELQKIEDGTLVELPCKVGGKVWFINCENKMLSGTVDTIMLNHQRPWLYKIAWTTYEVYIWDDRVFTTKESAEARLKELTEEE